MDFRGLPENGCAKLHFLVWNKVKIWRTPPRIFRSTTRHFSALIDVKKWNFEQNNPAEWILTFTLLGFHLAGQLSPQIHWVRQLKTLQLPSPSIRLGQKMAGFVRGNKATNSSTSNHPVRDSSFYRFPVARCPLPVARCPLPVPPAPFLVPRSVSSSAQGYHGIWENPGNIFHSLDCNLLIGASLDFVRPFRNFVGEGNQPICLGTI